VGTNWTNRAGLAMSGHWGRPEGAALRSKRRERPNSDIAGSERLLLSLAVVRTAESV